MAVAQQDSQLQSFFVYCPELSYKEGTEHLKILYYYPDHIPINKKIRNIGLCEAMVNFVHTFSLDMPCESVHMTKTRQVYFEPEPGIWMVLTVTVPHVEVDHATERSIEYKDNHVQTSVLLTALKRSYTMFRLFNGTFRNVIAAHTEDGLRKRLDMFFSMYWKTINVSQLDIFSVFQGLQFLPLDKIMYLKVHCFISLVETTFRQIRRSMFLYGDQLVWSGLEQEDTQILYQYLLPRILRPNIVSSSSTSSLSLTTTAAAAAVASTAGSVQEIPTISSGITSSLAQSSTGSFVIGGSGDGSSRNVWAYIYLQQQLTACRLFAYAANGCVLCVFVNSKADDSQQLEDFIKRLGIFLGPRIVQMGGDIKEYTHKSRIASSETQTRVIYFNELNLAVKSPLLSRRPSAYITPEMMHLMENINSEYDTVEEGETVIRTMAEYWLVARKCGHRRFFVLITQKNTNFQEVNEEVRRICQKEFSNIYFLD